MDDELKLLCGGDEDTENVDILYSHMYKKQIPTDDCSKATPIDEQHDKPKVSIDVKSGKPKVSIDVKSGKPKVTIDVKNGQPKVDGDDDPKGPTNNNYDNQKEEEMPLKKKRKIDAQTLHSIERKNQAKENNPNCEIMTKEEMIKNQQLQMIHIHKKAKEQSKSQTEKQKRRRIAFGKIVKKDVEADIKTTKKIKKGHDVLSRMENETSQTGPLKILYDCVKDGIKARVYIRRYKGLRGVITGYIVAFDTHMNLAMIDIEETYSIETWMIGEPLKKKRERKKKVLTNNNDNNIIKQSNNINKPFQIENKKEILKSNTTDILKKLTEKIKGQQSMIKFDRSAFTINDDGDETVVTPMNESNETLQHQNIETSSVVKSPLISPAFHQQHKSFNFSNTEHLNINPSTLKKENMVSVMYNVFSAQLNPNKKTFHDNSSSISQNISVNRHHEAVVPNVISKSLVRTSSAKSKSIADPRKKQTKAGKSRLSKEETDDNDLINSIVKNPVYKNNKSDKEQAEIIEDSDDDDNFQFQEFLPHLCAVSSQHSMKRRKKKNRKSTIDNQSSTQTSSKIFTESSKAVSEINTRKGITSELQKDTATYFEHLVGSQSSINKNLKEEFKNSQDVKNSSSELEKNATNTIQSCASNRSRDKYGNTLKHLSKSRDKNITTTHLHSSSKSIKTALPSTSYTDDIMKSMENSPGGSRKHDNIIESNTSLKKQSTNPSTSLFLPSTNLNQSNISISDLNQSNISTAVFDIDMVSSCLKFINESVTKNQEDLINTNKVFTTVTSTIETSRLSLATSLTNALSRIPASSSDITDPTIPTKDTMEVATINSLKSSSFVDTSISLSSLTPLTSSLTSLKSTSSKHLISSTTSTLLSQSIERSSSVSSTEIPPSRISLTLPSIETSSPVLPTEQSISSIETPSLVLPTEQSISSIETPSLVLPTERSMSSIETPSLVLPTEQSISSIETPSLVLPTKQSISSIEAPSLVLPTERSMSSIETPSLVLATKQSISSIETPSLVLPTKQSISSIETPSLVLATKQPILSIETPPLVLPTKQSIPSIETPSLVLPTKQSISSLETPSCFDVSLTNEIRDSKYQTPAVSKIDLQNSIVLEDRNNHLTDSFESTTEKITTRGHESSKSNYSNSYNTQENLDIFTDNPHKQLDEAKPIYDTHLTRDSTKIKSNVHTRPKDDHINIESRKPITILHENVVNKTEIIKTDEHIRPEYMNKDSVSPLRNETDIQPSTTNKSSKKLCVFGYYAIANQIQKLKKYKTLPSLERKISRKLNVKITPLFEEPSIKVDSTSGSDNETVEQFDKSLIRHLRKKYFAMPPETLLKQSNNEARKRSLKLSNEKPEFVTKKKNVLGAKKTAIGKITLKKSYGLSSKRKIESKKDENSFAFNLGKNNFCGNQLTNQNALGRNQLTSMQDSKRDINITADEIPNVRDHTFNTIINTTKTNISSISTPSAASKAPSVLRVPSVSNTHFFSSLSLVPNPPLVLNAPSVANTTPPLNSSPVLVSPSEVKTPSVSNTQSLSNIPSLFNTLPLSTTASNAISVSDAPSVFNTLPVSVVPSLSHTPSSSKPPLPLKSVLKSPSVLRTTSLSNTLSSSNPLLVSNKMSVSKTLSDSNTSLVSNTISVSKTPSVINTPSSSNPSPVTNAILVSRTPSVTNTPSSSTTTPVLNASAKPSTSGNSSEILRSDRMLSSKKVNIEDLPYNSPKFFPIKLVENKEDNLMNQNNEIDLIEETSQSESFSNLETTMDWSKAADNKYSNTYPPSLNENDNLPASKESCYTKVQEVAPVYQNKALLLENKELEHNRSIQNTLASPLVQNAPLNRASCHRSSILEDLNVIQGSSASLNISSTIPSCTLDSTLKGKQTVSKMEASAEIKEENIILRTNDDQTELQFQTNKKCNLEFSEEKEDGEISDNSTFSSPRKAQKNSEYVFSDEDSLTETIAENEDCDIKDDSDKYPELTCDELCLDRERNDRRQDNMKDKLGKLSIRDENRQSKDRDEKHRDKKSDETLRDKVHREESQRNDRDESKRDEYRDKTKRNKDRDESKRNKDRDESKRDKDRDESKRNKDREESKRNKDRDESKRDKDRDNSKRDKDRDNSKRDKDHDESKRNKARDESKRDKDRDESKQDRDRDESKRGKDRDKSKRDKDRDESKRDKDRDESKRDKDRDESKRDKDRDESKRDKDRDKSKRDKDRDESKRDKDRDESKRDKDRDESKRVKDRDESKRDKDRDKSKRDKDRDESKRDKEYNDNNLKEKSRSKDNNYKFREDDVDREMRDKDRNEKERDEDCNKKDHSQKNQVREKERDKGFSENHLVVNHDKNEKHRERDRDENGIVKDRCEKNSDKHRDEKYRDNDRDEKHRDKDRNEKDQVKDRCEKNLDKHRDETHREKDHRERHRNRCRDEKYLDNDRNVKDGDKKNLDKDCDKSHRDKERSEKRQEKDRYEKYRDEYRNEKRREKDRHEKSVSKDRDEKSVSKDRDESKRDEERSEIHPDDYCDKKRQSKDCDEKEGGKSRDKTRQEKAAVRDKNQDEIRQDKDFDEKERYKDNEEMEQGKEPSKNHREMDCHEKGSETGRDKDAEDQDKDDVETHRDKDHREKDPVSKKQRTESGKKHRDKERSKDRGEKHRENNCVVKRRDKDRDSIHQEKEGNVKHHLTDDLGKKDIVGATFGDKNHRDKDSHRVEDKNNEHSIASFKDNDDDEIERVKNKAIPELKSLIEDTDTKVVEKKDKFEYQKIFTLPDDSFEIIPIPQKSISQMKLPNQVDKLDGSVNCYLDDALHDFSSDNKPSSSNVIAELDDIEIYDFKDLMIENISESVTQAVNVVDSQVKSNSVSDSTKAKYDSDFENIIISKETLSKSNKPVNTKDDIERRKKNREKIEIKTNNEKSVKYRPEEKSEKLKSRDVSPKITLRSRVSKSRSRDKDQNVSIRSTKSNVKQNSSDASSREMRKPRSKSMSREVQEDLHARKRESSQEHLRKMREPRSKSRSREVQDDLHARKRESSQEHSREKKKHRERSNVKRNHRVKGSSDSDEMSDSNNKSDKIKTAGELNVFQRRTSRKREVDGSFKPRQYGRDGNTEVERKPRDQNKLLEFNRKNQESFLSRRKREKGRRDEEQKEMENENFQKWLQFIEPKTLTEHEKPERGKIFKRRYANQIFVRGDNIVLIAYDRNDK